MLKKEEKGIPHYKQKKKFCSLVVERTGDIENLCNSVNLQNLIYHFKGLTKDIKDFNDFIDTETLFDYTESKKIRSEDLGRKSKAIWIKVK